MSASGMDNVTFFIFMCICVHVYKFAHKLISKLEASHLVSVSQLAWGSVTA